MCQKAEVISFLSPYSVVASSTARRRALHHRLALAHFCLGLVTESLNTVATVERHSNLLIRVDEALQLAVELNVLAGQHIAVVLEGVNLGAHVNVLCVQRLGCETQIVLLASVAC